jgi:3-hydroxyisobutyrate dehydrogenase-like beta-hydroxyacid dehydrogenase
MVGGEEADFMAAQGVLGTMGKAVIHAGPNGAGQAAKVCNNMLLGASMIATCEASAWPGDWGSISRPSMIFPRRLRVSAGR